MKLYKIKKNKDGTNEIIEEIYGQTLERRDGWEELTDEEAAELRAKVYVKKQNKIKAETEKILDKHSLAAEEKETALINISNEIQEELKAANPNVNPEQTFADLLTDGQKARLKGAEDALQKLQDIRKNEILAKNKEIMDEQTEEQKRSYIVIEKARETAKIRADHVKQKREEINIANRNKKEMIIKKTNQFKEEAIDKINSSKNISSKQKKYEIEKLQDDIEKALSKWGL